MNGVVISKTINVEALELRGFWFLKAITQNRMKDVFSKTTFSMEDII